PRSHVPVHVAVQTAIDASTRAGHGARCRSLPACLPACPLPSSIEGLQGARIAGPNWLAIPFADRGPAMPATNPARSNPTPRAASQPVRRVAPVALPVDTTAAPGKEETEAGARHRPVHLARVGRYRVLLHPRSQDCRNDSHARKGSSRPYR